MSIFFERLRVVLLEEPTGNVRFFFGLIAIGYGFVIPGFSAHPMYAMSMEWFNPWIWTAAFMISGIALVWGALSSKPTRLGFILEGVLSWVAWFLLGLTTAVSQGMPGPTFFASLIAGWILVRYPTWKK